MAAGSKPAVPGSPRPQLRDTPGHIRLLRLQLTARQAIPSTSWLYFESVS